MTASFLQNILGPALGGTWTIAVEIAFGADLTTPSNTWTWTDVTADVQQGGGQRISIRPIGRVDWIGKTQPSGCAFVLDNTTGAYTRGPQSSHYPDILQRYIPLRVSVLQNTSRSVRYFGYITGLKPTFNTTGSVAFVNVSAYGRLRLLEKHTTPVKNVLVRYHLGSGAAAVWSFEDGVGSTQAANAVANGAPMQGLGVAFFGTPGFSDIGLSGTSAACHINDPGVGNDVFGAATNIPLSGEFHIDTWRMSGSYPDASETQLLVVDMVGGSGFGSTVELRTRMSQVSPLVKGGFIVRVGGVAVMDSGTGSPGSTVNPAVDGLWHNVHVKFVQSGGNVLGTLYVDGVVADSHTFTTVTLPSSAATTHLRCSTVAGSVGFGNDYQSVLALYGGAATPSWTISQNLYDGELVTDRLARLCAEEGVQLDSIYGTSDVAMGPQGPDTFLNLLRECEAADQGVLLDGLSQGLTYMTRAYRYGQNVQMTVNVATAQLNDPLDPQDDDQAVVNKATIQRRNGSSVTFEKTDGPVGSDAIGEAESTGGGQLNLFSDNQLAGIAQWIVHVGTDESPYRFSTLNLDFSAAPALVTSWLLLLPSNRIQVTNIITKAAQFPPGPADLMMEGWSEELSPFMWEVHPNCTPYAPWIVDVLNSTFRLELAGQTLAANLVPGATSLSLATAAGHSLSTTAVGNFPADLKVAGWPIHVTAASGSSSPQTLTITAAPNTSTIPSGTAVTLWQPAVPAL